MGKRPRNKGMNRSRYKRFASDNIQVGRRINSSANGTINRHVTHFDKPVPPTLTLGTVEFWSRITPFVLPNGEWMDPVPPRVRVQELKTLWESDAEHQEFGLYVCFHKGDQCETRMYWCREGIYFLVEKRGSTIHRSIIYKNKDRLKSLWLKGEVTWVYSCPIVDWNKTTADKENFE